MGGFADLGSRRQAYCTIAASTGLLSSGLALGWSSTAFPSLKSTIIPDLTASQEAWITALVPLTALVTTPLFGYSIDRFGRRPAMIAGAGLALLGWAFLVLARRAQEIYIGRVLCGASVGGLTLVVPIYVSEVSVPEIRGMLGTGAQSGTVLGILLSILLGSLLSWKTLAVVALVCPFVFLGLTLALVPESPRFLLKSDSHAAELGAKSVLCWLRGVDSPADVEFELNSIRDAIVAAETARTRTAKQKNGPTRENLTPILTSVNLMAAQQLSGCTGLLFYLMDVFQKAGATPDEAKAYMAVTGAISVVFLGFGAVLADRIGRRPLFLGSMSVMVAGLSALGAYTSYSATITKLGLPIGWIPVLSALTIFAGYAAGVGPVPWVLVSELLPRHAIGKTASLVSAVHFLLQFLVTFYFHELGRKHWNFALFTASSAVGGTVAYFSVPETNQKSLEEIQKEISLNVKATGQEKSLLKDWHDTAAAAPTAPTTGTSLRMPKAPKGQNRATDEAGDEGEDESSSDESTAGGGQGNGNGDGQGQGEYLSVSVPFSYQTFDPPATPEK